MSAIDVIALDNTVPSNSIAFYRLEGESLDHVYACRVIDIPRERKVIDRYLEEPVIPTFLTERIGAQLVRMGFRIELNQPELQQLDAVSWT